MVDMRTPIWYAEFRGFFWGEGCLDVPRYTSARTGQIYFAPRARIGMTAYEKPVLEEIKEEFGGALSFRASTNSWTWEVKGKDRLIHFCDKMEGGELGAAKSAQLAIFRGAVEAIPPRGRNYTDEIRAIMQNARDTLSMMKRG